MLNRPPSDVVPSYHRTRRAAPADAAVTGRMPTKTIRATSATRRTPFASSPPFLCTWRFPSAGSAEPSDASEPSVFDSGAQIPSVRCCTSLRPPARRAARAPGAPRDWGGGCEAGGCAAPKSSPDVLMPTAKTSFVTSVEDVEVIVHESEELPDDHPVVKATPELFAGSKGERRGRDDPRRDHCSQSTRCGVRTKRPSGVSGATHLRPAKGRPAASAGASDHLRPEASTTMWNVRSVA